MIAAYIAGALGSGLGATTWPIVLGGLGALCGRAIGGSLGALIGARMCMVAVSWTLSIGWAFQSYKNEFQEQNVASLSIGLGTLAVCIAGISGYLLYKIFVTKGPATTPGEYGKTWQAWTLFVFTLHLLPPAILSAQENLWAEFVNYLLKWFINAMTWGAMMFVAGWSYGKLNRQ